MKNNKKIVQLLEQLNEKADKIKKLLLMQGWMQTDDLPRDSHQTFIGGGHNLPNDLHPDAPPGHFLPRDQPGSHCHIISPDFNICRENIYLCKKDYFNHSEVPIYQPVINSPVGYAENGKLHLTISVDEKG